MNNAFAYCFNEATLATTGGMEIEQIQLLGQVSTIMRASTSKYSDLLSFFDNIEEKENGINISSLKQILINNHTQANRGNIKGHLSVEHVFGFCKTHKKIIKKLGFHYLTFRTNDLQDILFTTMANDITVTISSLYLFVPILIPDTKTQLIFNVTIKNNYTIIYDSRYSERKLSSNGNELHVEIGSAHNVNSPK